MFKFGRSKFMYGIFFCGSKYLDHAHVFLEPFINERCHIIAHHTDGTFVSWWPTDYFVSVQLFRGVLGCS